MNTTGFFQEGPGNNSITRVAFFIGVMWSLLITTYVVIFQKPPVGETIALLAGLVGPFLAMKLIQKPMETKNDSNTPGAN
jgi:hypothetical protein